MAGAGRGHRSAARGPQASASSGRPSAVTAAPAVAKEVPSLGTVAAPGWLGSTSLALWSGPLSP